MKLVSLSSTSFSVIPLADFFSKLSQYLASSSKKTKSKTKLTCQAREQQCLKVSATTKYGLKHDRAQLTNDTNKTQRATF